MLTQTIVKITLLEKKIFKDEIHLHQPGGDVWNMCQQSHINRKIMELQDRSKYSQEFFDDYNDKNSLDASIIKRMYSRFWVLSSEQRDDDGIAPMLTIKDFIEVSENHYREHNDISCQRTAKKTVKKMFHGVNKCLPLPTLLTPLTGKLISESEFKLVRSECGQNAHLFVNLYDQDDVIPFTPKNIIRYYHYPKKDAVNLYRNLCLPNIKLYMPVDDTNYTGMPPHEVTPITYLQNKENGRIKSVCWDVPDELKMINHDLLDKNDLIELIQNVISRPLPVSKLSLWRAMCGEWYNRQNNNFKWHELNADTQKRHIVNFIRHSYCGYTQIYTLQDRELAAELHDIAFDALLRRIGRTFPYLSGECVRQLNHRFDEVYY
ncbi:hypothetical protein [Photobacterium toruni]|uniref:hypothetical protein n=1 Tax=Photobacterium toruni TaxID=1935446 RepID=UPI002110B91F|nr:hypothetical protein [Photobacterium toruni]